MDFQLQTLKDALRIKAPQLPMPENYKELDIACPKCGHKTIICCYIASSYHISRSDYYDNFYHVCLNPNCHYAVYRTKYNGIGEKIEKKLCPCCKRNIFN